MMTAEELTIVIGESFHDWIDGDDPVVDYRYQDDDTALWVKFESGASFRVTVVGA